MPTPSPEARWLGRWFAAARQEGLLAALSPEAWHTLSAALSFTGRDGRRSFNIEQLAFALGRSSEETRERLERLAEIEWQGRPLASIEKDPHGQLVGIELAPLEALAAIQPPVKTLEKLEPDGDLDTALAGIGLEPDQAAALRGRFSEERLRRQLKWLPARQARNPAALFIRAVEQDWEAPKEAA